MTLLERITKILLYTAVFLIPFYFFRFKIFGLPTNVFEVAVGLTFISYLIYKIWEIGIWEFFTCLPVGTGSIRSIRLIRSILIFSLLLAAFAGVWEAGFSREALGIFKGWFLIPLILYFIIIKTVKQSEIKKLAIPLFLSLIIISIWAILQKIGVVTTLFYQKNDSNFDQYLLSANFRVFGPFESPNYLAMYLLPTAFLSLPLWELAKSRLVKTGIIFGYLLALIALFLSGSRAGAIASIAGVVLLLLINSRKYIQSKIEYYSLSLMILISGGFLLYLYGFNPASDNIRIEIYHYSLQLLRNNWLCGIGLGNFQTRISEITVQALSFRTHALPYALHPHNLYLAFWLNLGLLGIIAFTVLVVDFYKKIFSIKQHQILFISLFLAMTAILVHGLFDTPYFKNDLSALFWLTMAFGVINISSLDPCLRRNDTKKDGDNTKEGR